MVSCPITIYTVNVVNGRYAFAVTVNVGELPLVPNTISFEGQSQAWFTVIIGQRVESVVTVNGSIAGGVYSAITS